MPKRRKSCWRNYSWWPFFERPTGSDQSRQVPTHSATNTATQRSADNFFFLQESLEYTGMCVDLRVRDYKLRIPMHQRKLKIKLRVRSFRNSKDFESSSTIYLSTINQRTLLALSLHKHLARQLHPSTVSSRPSPWTP